MPSTKKKLRIKGEKYNEKKNSNICPWFKFMKKKLSVHPDEKYTRKQNKK
jgi:hypothetical protein